jgi:hypothetical protein
MGKELSLQFGASLDGQHSSLPNYMAGVLTNGKKDEEPIPDRAPTQPARPE